MSEKEHSPFVNLLMHEDVAAGRNVLAHQLRTWARAGYHTSLVESGMQAAATELERLTAEVETLQKENRCSREQCLDMERCFPGPVHKDIGESRPAKSSREQGDSPDG